MKSRISETIVLVAACAIIYLATGSEAKRRKPQSVQSFDIPRLNLLLKVCFFLESLLRTLLSILSSTDLESAKSILKWFDTL